MRSILAAFVALNALAVSGSCLAWSANGHQTVGAIADQLLAGTPAQQQVQAILGSDPSANTLSAVSVWADCARAIHPAQGFVYDPGKFREIACQPFETDDGKRAMREYVQRNNTNCPYAGKNLECHKSYHFADVDVHRDSYDDNGPKLPVGVQPYDVVHAIHAAVAVLRGQPCPAPFNFASKWEALALLTHFVGDVHQPLHVGAVYLDQEGAPVEIDTIGYQADDDTRGGNLLMGSGGNLHHQWDTTQPDFSNATALGADVTRARAVPPTGGPSDHWPEIWASDSVAAAQDAFVGLSFQAKTTLNAQPAWPMDFDDRRSYAAHMKQAQARQIAKAGAHLAELLRSIWP